MASEDGEPTRAEIDSHQAPLLVEFGAAWCAHCQRARPLIDDVLARHPEIGHLRVEDGPGRRLGRSFRVKLWPTLVFMNRGAEVARLVRPAAIQEIDEAIEQQLSPRQD